MTQSRFNFISFQVISINCHHSHIPMFTASQSSSEITKIPEAIASLKPWYFKPKKSLFRVDDDHSQLKKRKFNQLHWKGQENLRYAEFLSTYLHLVESKVPEKRKFHLNRIMSKHIRTRSPQQCRSHHQKMIKSFKTIQAIIEHFLGHKSGPAQQQLTFQDCFEAEVAPKDVQRSHIDQFLHNAEDIIEPKSSEVASLWPLKARDQCLQFGEDQWFQLDIHTFPQLQSWSL